MGRSIPAGVPRALLLNGALADDREVDAVADLLAAELARLGLTTQSVTMRELQVAPCLGCFDCWTRSPGVCKTKDAGRDLARAHVRANLVAYVTPVTFGGYSSELKKAIDRMICVELPFFTRVGGEVHHRPRYARRPALLVIGILREPDPAQERTFHELVRRNAVNLQASASASRVLVRPCGVRVGDRIDPDLRDAIAGILGRSGAPSSFTLASGGAR
jgi:multimeric flavodoxin WrbA